MTLPAFIHVRAGRGKALRESVMKLPLIAASVFAYTVLTLAWICYTELTLP